MRVERLLATLLLLQRRGRVTAAELAAELEVSVATARRDLEALAGAGVPVYPQPGRGGGWQLVGGARTDLTGLTAGEAEALFLLLGRGGSQHERTAVHKLLQALPATFRADAEAAGRAVHVDPDHWGAAPIDDDRDRLAGMQRAVIRRQVLELDYRHRDGRRGVRRVQPYGLVDKDGTWYLLAGTLDGRRTFRADRVQAITPTDERFEPPADLDLAAWWAEVVQEVEPRRSGVRAEVDAPAALLPVLRGLFGRYLVELGTAEDRTRVEVGAHSAVGLAEQLAGLAGHTRVLGPPAVIEELARIGAALTAAYGQGGPDGARSPD